MKKTIILFFSILFVFFISCDNNSSSKEDNCSPACHKVENCNEGTCELKEGSCYKDKDCGNNTDGNTICNTTTNKCEKAIDKNKLLDNIIYSCIKEKACNNKYNIEACVRNIYNPMTLDTNSLNRKYDYSTNYINILNTRVNCVLESQSCEEINSCYGIVETQIECDDNYSPNCEQNTLKYCYKNKIMEKDCDKQELSCMNIGGEAFTFYWCAYKPDDLYCDDDGGDDTYESICVDSKTRKYCLNHRFVERDCEYELGEGATCEIREYEGKKYSRCVSAKQGEHCDEEKYEVNCEGSYIKYCGESNTVEKLDCKKLSGNNFSCFIFSGGSLYKAFSNNYTESCTNNEIITECSNNNTECNGDTLRYCVNNQEKTFNCVENGYTSCSTFKDEFGLDEGYCSFEE